MVKIEWYKTINAFANHVKPQLFIYGISLFCFGIVAFLTRYPFSYMLYSSILLTAGFLVYLLWHWTKYLKRYQVHQSLQNFDIDVLKEIPFIQDPAELLYHEKLHSLRENIHFKTQENLNNKREQMDYFTLWLHQIKTPIAAMSLLNQQLPSSKEKRQMEQELLRIEDYTHMALNYLKLEGTNQELDLSEVELDGIIRKVIKKYAILFIYNGIKLDYEATNIKVITDGQWLEILLEQILSNALKYAPKGRICIYADVSKEATLIIEDNGVGIRAEDLPKIFEKGYSGLNGRLHEKSTGLGLFLTKKICQRLGHTIEIDSKVNEYTKVALHMEREDIFLYD